MRSSGVFAGSNDRFKAKDNGIRPVDSFVITSRHLLGSVVQGLQVDKAIVANDPHLQAVAGCMMAGTTSMSLDCEDYGRKWYMQRFRKRDPG
jgi:hypothetical protein